MELILFFLILNFILFIHRLQNEKEYEGRLQIAFLVPLAIAGASAIYQGIKGAKQKREAKKLQTEADQLEAVNEAEARRMAMTGIPAEQYQKARQDILRQQATALGYARDRRSALLAAPAIQQQTSDALLNLSAQDAAMRRQAEQGALSQANRRATLRGQQAAYERQAGEALTGAAMQNVFNIAGYAAGGLGGNGAQSGLFGNTPEGSYNRAILGTRGIAGMQPVSSGLSKPLPKIPYSQPY